MRILVEKVFFDSHFFTR